jgi:polyvinyl alcohol dehydrogenase (cytochrome)
MGAGGLAALDPATGATVWKFAPKAPSGNGTSALGAAPTTIPGVVFTGSTNGMLYAVSAADGKELWSFDTSKTFDAVNKVPTHGGAIASSGAVVVDGMLFVGSGYAVSSGASGGNALLAFGVR